MSRSPGTSYALKQCADQNRVQRTVDDVLIDTRRITDVCDLPLLVDVDTGFGSSAFNVARTVKSLAPLIERLRIATPQELDTDTLEARLGTETQAVHGHFIPCYLLNAWARKPM